MTDKPLFPILASLLALLLAGCAGTMSRLHVGSALKTRTIASDEIRFDDFRAVVDGADLILTGAVKRRDGLHRAYGGHIDLAVLDASGLTITALSTVLSPNSTLRARLSYFKVVLPARSALTGQAVAAFHLPETGREGWGYDCGDNRALTEGKPTAQ